MTAPHVSPRELSRPDFPAVVHTYTDALRLLRDEGPLDTAALAERTARDRSNMRRDLSRLVSAQVISAHPGGTFRLTEKGARWVQGQDVAAGETQVGDIEPKRWPVDKIRPNPANRRVDPAGVEDLADAIIGAGDVLQPLLLTPPDANGVRMLLAGERRWRAVQFIQNRDAEHHNENVLDGSPVFFNPDLPEPLEAGVPFVERDATEGEAALIAVIENTARKDLSPWADAKLLKAAADGLGITNASELARRIGRAREGDRGGLRDVQTKLRVAREATPEAITAYEQNGSWDQLRDSVTTPKAPTIGPQVAQHGAAVLGRGAQASAEDRDQPEMFETVEDTLSPLAELALVEVLWAMRFAPFTSGEYGPAVLTNGYAYRSSGLMEAVRGEYIQYTGYDLEQGRACVVVPTSKGRAWGAERFETGAPTLSKLIEWREKVEPEAGQPDAAENESFSTIALNSRHTRERLTARKPQTPVGPHVVNGIDYGNATRANDARRALGLLPPLPPANYGGAKADPFSPGIGAQILGNHLRGLDDDERPDEPSKAATVPAAPVPPAAVMRDHLAAQAQAREHPTNAALRLIADERRRQVESEGYSPDQDDEQNEDGEMALAAAAYAASAAGDPDCALFWPGGWDPHMFKPAGETRDLVRAGALIVAELERRARLSASATEVL